MVREHLESVVLDVVLDQADAGEVRRLNSSTTVLDVDQLTMTHIVLALETQLGIELPTYLEDARTITELVTGALEALRGAQTVQTEDRPVGPQDFPLGDTASTVLA